MSEKLQEDPTLSNLLEVIEQTEATDLVKALEARGDFKFKGIYVLYSMIMDWTIKFPVNNVLPAFEQMERESKLSADKLKDYLTELLGRGSSDTKYVYAIPAVEVSSTGDAGISRFLVYCRPLKTDGPTARRYVTAYVDINSKMLERWLKKRPLNQGEEYANFLIQHADKGRLPDTHAGTEIARMFYNDLDTTPEAKKATYSMISRPVIQKLINNKGLLLLKAEEILVPVLPGYRSIFYNNTTEMEFRLRTLAGYIFKNVLRDASLAQSARSLEINEINQKVGEIPRNTFNSLPVGQKQAMTEVILLARALESMKKEEQEKKKTEDLEKILADVHKYGRLMDFSALKASDEIKNSLLNVKAIMHTDYPLHDRVATFVLHRDCVPTAIKFARELYDKTGNDSDVLILLAMGIEQVMSPEDHKLFDNLLQRVYFDQLPLLKKLWKLLFGGDDLKPEEQAKIKSDIAKKAAEEKLRIKTEEAKREKKKLVSKRLKESKDSSEPEYKSNKPEKEADSVSKAAAPEKTPEEIQKEKDAEGRAKEHLKKICDDIDRAWDGGLFPNRTYVLENNPEFTEDSLIHFLKKYAQKEIYSFRIRHDKPEFIWPILISKNYIKKNGKKLMEKAAKEADEQRAASMPNQEKFNIATSIEDFFNKFLSKPR